MNQNHQNTGGTLSQWYWLWNPIEVIYSTKKIQQRIDEVMNMVAKYSTHLNICHISDLFNNLSFILVNYFIYILHCWIWGPAYVHIWEDIWSTMMMISLPWCLWQAGLCNRCKCCSVFPPPDSGTSAAQSIWCRPCCPDRWLKPSVTLHWEACWQHSGHVSKGQTGENIYHNFVIKSRSFSRSDEKEILQSEGKSKWKCSFQN